MEERSIFKAGKFRNVLVLAAFSLGPLGLLA
jgi:hypothetical protein